MDEVSRSDVIWQINGIYDLGDEVLIEMSMYIPKRGEFGELITKYKEKETREYALRRARSELLDKYTGFGKRIKAVLKNGTIIVSRKSLLGTEKTERIHDPHVELLIKKITAVQTELADLTAKIKQKIIDILCREIYSGGE